VPTADPAADGPHTIDAPVAAPAPVPAPATSDDALTADDDRAQDAALPPATAPATPAAPAAAAPVAAFSLDTELERIGSVQLNMAEFESWILSATAGHSARVVKHVLESLLTFAAKDQAAERLFRLCTRPHARAALTRVVHVRGWHTHSSEVWWRGYDDVARVMGSCDGPPCEPR
jgi:hypothetical protein